MHHDTEAVVRARVMELLDAWAQTGPGSIDRFLPYLSESFTGLGTGPGDYYASRDDVREMMVREQTDMPYPVTVSVPELHVRVLQPDVSLAEGALNLEIDIDGNINHVAPRFSFIFQMEGDQWLLSHFHFSEPDVSQIEGGTLMDALQERNRRLEEEVARRTRELAESLENLKATQAQLVQQEKMASLGVLTAGIAHEIKNPLNFINNFAAISAELIDEASEETDPEIVREMLEDLRVNVTKIEEHGRRADSIVRSMLEHSRSTGGERRATDINSLVSEYIDLAWHGKQAQGVSVDVEMVRSFGEDVGEVEIVPQEIGRVLLNLIGNAIDAVVSASSRAQLRGRPSVMVTTRRDRGYVEVSVADNGGGVEGGTESKIFEPFFTTKPTGSGTGLGLSLSYDIVSQGHRGTLLLENDEGRGATFIMRLPVSGS